MNQKKILLSIFFLALCLGIGFYFGKFYKKQRAASVNPVEEWKTAQLKDTSNRSLKLSELDGKLFVVYFGFSHCPDMCPMALNDIEDSFKLLGDDSEKATPIFITVDPERDTPEVLGKYIERFPGKKLVALTGGKDQIESLQKGFGAFSQKVKVDSLSDGYGVDHTLFIYLVDKTGNILRAFPTGIKGEELAKEIREVF